MILGIRAHDLGKMSMLELTAKAKSIGFDGIQLVVNKALLPEPNLTIEDFKSLENNRVVPVLLLGSYFNPVHSDQDKVTIGMDRFKKQLELGQILNTQYVATETGSFSDEPWIFHENNHLESSYQLVLERFKILSEVATKNHMQLLLEPAKGHVIYSAQRMFRLMKDLEDKHLVILDLYNLLDITNYRDYLAILNNALEILKPYIKVFHLKNFIVENTTLKQVGLTDGYMNYDVILPLLLKNNPDAFFIFEGVTGEAVIKSLDYIKHIKETNHAI